MVRKNKRKQGSRRPLQRRNLNRMDLSINRSLNPMPSRYRTRLTYNDFVTMSNAGAVFANVRYEPTYAYDVSPAVGSTAMPFFTEIGACYRLYRVDRAKIVCTFANKDAATSAVCYVCPVNFDPSNNTTLYENYISNRRSRSRLVGPINGSGTCRLANHFAVDEFSGVKWSGQVDNYTGTISGTAPTNNVWFIIGIHTDANMTLGVTVNLVITIELDFFELNSPST